MSVPRKITFDSLQLIFTAYPNLSIRNAFFFLQNRQSNNFSTLRNWF